MVLLGKFGNFSYFCMQIGCLLAKFTCIRDLRAHLLVLLELGFLFAHLAFHLLDLFDQFAFLIGGENLGLLAVLHELYLFLEFFGAAAFLQIRVPF